MRISDWSSDVCSSDLVPLLFNPTYADYVQAYGQGGLKAARLDSLKHLARLYWYTVEFGLIATSKGLRVYGAGILSSGGEIVHSVESPEPRRVRFSLERLLRSRSEEHTSELQSLMRISYAVF